MGCEGLKEGLSAAGAVLHYLLETQKGKADHVREITVYANQANTWCWMKSTRRNLELTATLAEGKRKGSLLGLMDRTVDRHGGRKLKQWINYPLMDLENDLRAAGRGGGTAGRSGAAPGTGDLLDGVHDLERLNGRISLASASAKDLVALSVSLCCAFPC